MKKLFLFCMLAAVAAFVSCSKDDDGGSVSKGNLVGTWEVFKEVEKEDGDVYVDEEWGSSYGLIWTMEFHSDGTCVETFKVLDSRYGWSTNEEYETYTLNGNTLRIKHYDDYDDEYYYEDYTVEKLTSNQLVITYKEPGYSDTLYLKRI